MEPKLKLCRQTIRALFSGKVRYRYLCQACGRLVYTSEKIDRDTNPEEIEGAARMNFNRCQICGRWVCDDCFADLERCVCRDCVAEEKDKETV